jgi:hypothetical protein
VLEIDLGGSAWIESGLPKEEVRSPPLGVPH